MSEPLRMMRMWICLECGEALPEPWTCHGGPAGLHSALEAVEYVPSMALAVREASAAEALPPLPSEAYPFGASRLATPSTEQGESADG